MKRIIFVIAALCCGAHFQTVAKQPVNAAAFDSLVADVCSKKIVLLGEDSHHGSGKTIETKSLLVERLIAECGFSAVFFESPVYEFMHFNRSVLANTATQQQLTQSIGGLWSTTQSIAPLLPSLFGKAVAGKLRLDGIDAQSGAANQPFSQSQLAKRFSRYLPVKQQQECERELYRNMNWLYDEQHPYNEQTSTRIAACISAAKAAVDKVAASNSEITDDKIMLDNYVKYLAFSQGDYFNLRDKAMAENITRQLSVLPVDAKAIVWCATIHAAKTLEPLFAKSKKPMGAYLHQTFKDQVASIGFSALRGSFGRAVSQVQPIEPASLASSALSGNHLTVAYLDKKQLAAIGSVAAQAISYGDIHEIDWSTVLDGMVIHREEQPLRY